MGWGSKLGGVVLRCLCGVVLRCLGGVVLLCLGGVVSVCIISSYNMDIKKKVVLADLASKSFSGFRS
jgi:hypothetical protein